MPGANAAVLAACVRSGRDPGTHVEFAAFGRWHREAWLGLCATGPEDLLHEADLKAAGLMALKAEFVNPKGRRPPISPVAAAMRAAKLVGWKLDRSGYIAVPGTAPLSTLTPAAPKMGCQTARCKQAVEQNAQAWSETRTTALADYPPGSN